MKTVNFNTAGDYFVSGGGDNLVLIWKTNFDDYIDGIYKFNYLFCRKNRERILNIRIILRNKCLDTIKI